MSADMVIHIMEHIDKETLKCFFSDTIGSSYQDDLYTCPEGKKKITDCSHWNKMTGSPQVAVGEVSWLKASLLENDDRFIPETIGAIENILGEPTVVTPDIIERVTQAFDLPNQSDYPIPQAESKREEIRKFLTEHQGHYAFTISW